MTGRQQPGDGLLPRAGDRDADGPQVLSRLAGHESGFERIERIKQLKELLGFSLSEIGEMLDAEELAEGAAGRHVAPMENRFRSDVAQDGLRRQLELIDQKMAGMARLREQIAARLSHYERPRPGAG